MQKAEERDKPQGASQQDPTGKLHKHNDLTFKKYIFRNGGPTYSLKET